VRKVCSVFYDRWFFDVFASDYEGKTQMASGEEEEQTTRRRDDPVVAR
jgi:hypothetical protein